LQKPLRILESAQALMAGKVQQMDMGCLPNGRYWLLWAGVGADSYVVEHIEPRPKWSKELGRLGYTLQTLAVAPGFRPMQAVVEIDGRFFEDEFILVLISNCRLYAGGQVILSPQARLDDGMWEVWLFRGQNPADVFHHLVQALRGKHLQDRKTTLVNGRSITIHTTPTMPYQTDGDPTGKTPLTCEIKPGVLHLLVPTTAPKDLFNQPGKLL
jgi:diacylglycerol kinase (ATP)